jgi:hypothetical protein
MIPAWPPLPDVYSRSPLASALFRFAPLDGSTKKRLPEASKAPFWAGAALSTLALWLLLHRSLATPDAVFFFNLGKLVVALGGVVGGLATVFMPRLATRAMVGTVLGVAFCVVADANGVFPPAAVLAASVGFSLSTLCFARPVRCLIPFIACVCMRVFVHRAWVVLRRKKTYHPPLRSLSFYFSSLSLSPPSLSLAFSRSIPSLPSLTLSISLCVCQAHEAWSMVLATSLVGALLVLLSADAKLGSGFYEAIDHMARGQGLHAASAANPMLAPAALAFLVVLPAAGAALQASALGLWRLAAPPQLPTPLPTPPPPAAALSVARPPSLEGDKGAFNYVDPLDLPPKYEQFCGALLFRNADALMYFFGFQVFPEAGTRARAEASARMMRVLSVVSVSLSFSLFFCVHACVSLLVIFLFVTAYFYFCLTDGIVSGRQREGPGGARAHAAGKPDPGHQPVAR